MELTEKNRTGDFVLSLAPGTLSLENGVLNAGQDLQAGTVVAELLAAVGSKISGNGDGVIGAVTLGSAAEVGTYVLTVKTAAANAGTFSVRTPSGAYLPDLTVAVAYASSHINLTVADGATDWGAGAVVHVVVAAGDYEQLDPAATDGAQIAGGLLYANTNATDADQACVVVARQAEVKADGLVWPVGITEAQQLAAIAQLNRRGIYLR